MSMGIRRLEVFCNVIEKRSFSKAAEAVYLSQPTVSEHIKLLEQFVGDRLIERLGKTVVPTHAGEVLYKYAKEILALRDEAVAVIENLRGKIGGKLRVGCSTIPGTYILPYFLGGFINAYPDVRISLTTSDSRDITAKVAENELDVGLVGATFRESRVVYEEILSDELVLAVYPNHPLLRKQHADPEDLYRYPYINREFGSGTRAFVERNLRNLGISISRFKIVLEVGSTEAVRHAIKAGIGISILSRKAIDDDVASGSLYAIRFNGLKMMRYFYLVRHKGRNPSPVCKSFIETIKKWSVDKEGGI